MQFSNSQSVSFKTPDEGDYVGILVGFCYVGMHDTQDWGPKAKCMIRWELHDLEAPHASCVDDERLPYVVTQMFPATVQGDSSWLRKCLIAHGIAVAGGVAVDSKTWYGHAARLTIEQNPGKRDRIFANVTEINRLDKDVNIKPGLNYEHWEPSDTTPPPGWAKFMLERSNDLAYRVAGVSVGTQGAAVGGTARPAAPQSPAVGGYQAPEHDEDEIPF